MLAFAIAMAARLKTVRHATVAKVTAEMRALGNATIAAQSKRICRTGPDDEIFLGVRQPAIRQLAKTLNPNLAFATELLDSDIHEIRMLGVVAMVNLYKKAPEDVFNAYMAKTDRLSGWDLVDVSAVHIVGAHLLERDRSVLYELAHGSVWERRIAVIATHAFIKKNQFDDTLNLAKLLLNDEHDLIHKAVGWMLREVGKRDQAAEIAFLDAHYQAMPRVMLYYSLEKFPKQQRMSYLKPKR